LSFTSEEASHLRNTRPHDSCGLDGAWCMRAEGRRGSDGKRDTREAV
jgi:hypothetical protein